MSDPIVSFEGWSRSQGWGYGPFGTGGPVTGLGTGAVGTVSVDIGVELTGVSATGYVGTVLVPQDTVYVTGVQGLGQIGTVSVVANCNVFVSGVEAVGTTGSVFVWGEVVPPSASGWTPIVPF